MGHEEFVMTPQSHLNLWSGTNYTGDLCVCVCWLMAAHWLCTMLWGTIAAHWLCIMLWCLFDSLQLIGCAPCCGGPLQLIGCASGCGVCLFIAAHWLCTMLWGTIAAHWLCIMLLGTELMCDWVNLAQGYVVRHRALPQPSFIGALSFPFSHHPPFSLWRRGPGPE
jgi:hypothetical protein